MTAETLQLSSNDIYQVNERNSKLLSSISERVQSVDVDKLNALESSDMSMEYWELLKTSKSNIKSLKNKVDSIVDACDEWNQILLQQIDGKQLQKSQIDFTSYVADEFKVYFDNDDAILNQQNNQWATFVQKLRNKIVSISEPEPSYGPTIKNCGFGISVFGFITAMAPLILKNVTAEYEDYLPLKEQYHVRAGLLFIAVGIALIGIVMNSQNQQTHKIHENVQENKANEEYRRSSPPPSFKNTNDFFSAFNIDHMKRHNLEMLCNNLQTISKQCQSLQEQCQNMKKQINSKQNAFTL
eukprot:263344_1